ncbi:alpha/beta hydrolase family protein [Aneurinibacillus thermoaerophilus]|uniref:alpha/beta hydrolase family protein n=1 Tax=Aneurinibacillus thermoaerophilus TaxID=143495 RepID=UPI002E1DB1D8|nr:prolyl oligopeptidase family serine peptidase [Aneurinibacillus thermoaerophilus]MED0736186.1 prolyl oligopeptidase family serine peptidase [Aneurinibacillus thermoaerophilus]
MLISRIALPSSLPDVSVYHILYKSGDAVVAGYLARPKAPDIYPGLVYCRGGIRRVGMVQITWIEHMAACGFVVCAPSYRGNEGGEGHDEFGGADREDVYGAFDLLAHLSWVDKKRLAVIGFSRGAMGAFLAAAEMNFVRAVVSWGGVVDLHLTYEERADLRRMLRRVVGHPVKDARAYMERSALYRAEDITCPVLFIQGGKDEQVSPRHARYMIERLERLGKPFTVWYYPQYGHHFPKAAHYGTISEACHWLKDVLSVP